jgi:hypothetical protein
MTPLPKERTSSDAPPEGDGRVTAALIPNSGRSGWTTQRRAETVPVTVIRSGWTTRRPVDVAPVTVIRSGWTTRRPVGAVPVMVVRSGYSLRRRCRALRMFPRQSSRGGRPTSGRRARSPGRPTADSEDAADLAIRIVAPRPSVDPVLLDRVWELAGVVGLLHRRVEPETNLGFLADRLAQAVSTVYLLLTPSAGELVSWWAPGDEKAATEAIRVVDREWESLQRRLGRKPT